MKKLKKIFSVLLVFLVLMGSYAESNLVFANSDCSYSGINIIADQTNIKDSYNPNDTDNKILITLDGVSNGLHILTFHRQTSSVTRVVTVDNDRLRFETTDLSLFVESDNLYTIYLNGPGINAEANGRGCKLATYSVNSEVHCDHVYIYQVRNNKTCYGGPESSNSCIESSRPIVVESKLSYSGNSPFSGTVIHEIQSTNCTGCGDDVFSYSDTADENGISTTEHSLEVDDYKVLVREDRLGIGGRNRILCEYNFSVTRVSCNVGGEEVSCNEDAPKSGGLLMQYGSYSLCDQIPDSQPDQREKCLSCIGSSISGEGDEGVWTALGCIKKEPTTIIRQLINIGLGMAGGFTLLTFLAAGFSYTTAQGDVKKVTEAREQITAALVGLLFIIFSVTILQFVGTTVLKIPGFGG